MRIAIAAICVLFLTSIVFANFVTYESVQLKNLKGEVTVMESEWENSKGLEMSHPTCGGIQTYLDKAGVVTQYVVSLGPLQYWDLNGDGTLDARYRRDINQADIWLGESWVQVRHTKDGFSSHKKRSVDGKSAYVFRDGRWGDR